MIKNRDMAPLARNCSELIYAWRTAQEEALDAYDAWRFSPGRTEYLVYRAAQDRADAAQDVVAETVPILPCAPT
jgi:hypothetical protein